jgi:PTS system ascorbate-specific IIA component
MAVKEPVYFGKDADGNDKYARLFFTLASENSDEHMANIQDLVSVFTNEELLDALLECQSGQDILDAQEKYPGGRY